MAASAVRFAAGFLAGAAIGFFAANTLDRSRQAAPAPAAPAASAPAPAAATGDDANLTDEELRRVMAAVDARPNDYEANFKLGEFLLRIRSKPADAIRYYTRASKLKPDAADPLAGLAVSLAVTGDVKGAEAALARLEKVAPGSSAAAQVRAVVERAKKQ